ncbi:MAG: flagellar biosynthetic protein FliR [Clostridia bacterium]|nr:flagellar biosynthetic protein FliR [Clostridia bacterium]
MLFYDYVIVTILVFTRMAAMFGIIPIFNANNTPTWTKVWFIFFLAMVVVPQQVATYSLEIENFLELAGVMVVESLIGFAMGLIVLVVMNVFYLAGSLVDRDIGFAMVSVIGVEDESELPITSNLYYIFAMMVFLLTNVHHQLIRAIVASYKTMPMGSNPVMGLLIYDYIELLQYSFITGFQMAAPFIITILIANILLGLLSKAMPGMNVFMIGMPLKILVGLFLLSLMMTVYPNMMIDVFETMLDGLAKLIGQ